MLGAGDRRPRGRRPQRRGDRPPRRGVGPDAARRGDARSATHSGSALRSPTGRRRCWSATAWAGWRSRRRPHSVPDRVAALIYVSAFVPQDGQSLRRPDRLPEAAGDQVQANIVVEGDPPVARMPAEAAPQALYHCCAARAGRVGGGAAGPQPVAAFTQPVSLSDADAAVRRAAAGVRLVSPGPRDPARDAAADVHGRWLRSGDRDRHRSLTVAVPDDPSWCRR